jgi:hypothetical protein
MKNLFNRIKSGKATGQEVNIAIKYATDMANKSS